MRLARRALQFDPGATGAWAARGVGAALGAGGAGHGVCAKCGRAWGWGARWVQACLACPHAPNGC